MGFFSGTPEKFEQRFLLGPGQKGTYNQLNAASQGAGAGGAFGQAADYYRSLLNEDNSTYNAFAAPEMRQFNEQIVPGLAEQFAGMGSGGLSSSGFRNAQLNAGTDLQERLAALRAGLRQQGAQGLQGIGQMGLQQYHGNSYRPESEGFWKQSAPGLLSAGLGAVGSIFGPAGTAAGSGLGNIVGSWFKSPSGQPQTGFGSTGVYG